MKKNKAENLGHQPLTEYAWSVEVERLLKHFKQEHSSFHAFLFDVMMSLAYIDATAGLEKSIEYCESCPKPYNAHLGFINLCATCYKNDKWHYQKAAKPQSGAIGKLTSEMVLKFFEVLNDDFKDVRALGGTGLSDAITQHSSGITIYAEVKSAPLITYPVLFSLPNAQGLNHTKPSLTTSQLNSCDSALFLHDDLLIALGNPSSEFWPFKGVVDYFLDNKNAQAIVTHSSIWLNARQIYINKTKEDKLFYLTNACGAPPSIAKNSGNWQKDAVISDSKTSVGMDRTDDIKKGIYQTLKIGVTNNLKPNCKTAIVSNLPAYRHTEEYIEPLLSMVWGDENDTVIIENKKVIARDKLKYIFDYLITLDEPILRDLKS